MKKDFPVYNINDVHSGISINRLSDAFVGGQMDTLAEFHRNDFYVLFLLKAGNASLHIDFQQLDVQAGSMVFLYPGQVQKVVSINNSDGWVLFFDYKLIDEHSKMVLEESLHDGAKTSISGEQQQWFDQMMELLSETANLSEMGSFQKPAMLSLLMPCIYRVAAIYQARELSGQGIHSARTLSIIREFRKLVREQYQTLKRPKDYAGRLNLSLGYLNDTVRAVTGFSVSDTIRQQVLKEAQRLLYHSDLSIKEIASATGFEDPKYFSRFFSKATKLSPVVFRKNYRGDNVHGNKPDTSPQID